MKKIYSWLISRSEEIAKLLLIISVFITAYSVHLSSKVNESNYLLNKVRTIKEGVNFLEDTKNAPAARGLILNQLVNTGLSLGGLDLSKIYLYNLDCTGDCEYLDFSNSKLVGIMSYKSKYYQSTFSRANLSTSRFEKDGFMGDNFDFANLNNTLFIDSSLSNIDFTKTDLCGVTFVNTYLINVKFNSNQYYLKKCGKTKIPCTADKKANIKICSKERKQEVLSNI